MIPNGHFHKDWQRYIKLWFNQPMRKERRHLKRVQRAKRVAPRPTRALKPIVICPSLRYNSKFRLGRGFTLQELKQAGINKKQARTIGISFDPRRQNKCVDSIQRNVQRLKEYRSRMILFPINSKKPRKGDSTAEEIKLASQLQGVVLPLKSYSVRPDEAPRVPTEDEKKFRARRYVMKALYDKKFKGRRDKKIRQAAEAAESKK